jgi:hypothetical protein
MSFVYPNFLWALLLLIIPIIIHLFNFRKYQTVYFSKVDFLTEVVEDSKSGNKLKHLLVLLSRLLMITALILAFSQPFIPTFENQKTDNITSIYIDNSFSMQAQGQDGDLLNEVKNKAIDLVKSLNQNEKINLLTTDLLAKDQRFYAKSEIIERIKEIGLTPISTPLSTILEMQTDLLQKSKANANQRLFLLSDFQKSTSTLVDFSKNELPAYYYQAKSEIQGNIFIDSVWFESPVKKLNSPIKVFFRIKNQSSSEVNDLNIALTIDGKEKGWQSLNIAPNSYIEESINFTNTSAGVKKGKLHIKTNQLFFDDDYFFTYTINEHVNILIVTNEKSTKNIEKLYQLNSFYNYSTSTINSIKQEDFKNKHLIILQNTNSIPSGIQDKLTSSLKNGSTVCLIPGVNADLNNWNSFLGKQKLPTLMQHTDLKAELNYFNAEDPLFNGVFQEKPSRYQYAEVYSTYKLNITSSHNFIALFNYNSTEPFLLYANQKNGRLFLQTSPMSIDFTDFQNHALFATTYLRMAETSALNKKLSFTIGEPSSYPLYQDLDEKDLIHLINDDLQTDLIPSIINTNSSREIVFDQLFDKIKVADYYKLENKNTLNDIIAFNYSRAESEIENLSAGEIQINFENSNWLNVKELQINSNGQIEILSLKTQEYWRILLFLALLFIAIEILLLKFWKS